MFGFSLAAKLLASPPSSRPPLRSGARPPHTLTMPLYTPGRRRAIVLLLLTSALLLTLDLRGSSIFETARAGFRRALEPFETAADVVTKPIRNAWHGIMDYDDLAQENQELREQIDAQISDQIAGRAFIQAYQDLLALNELPALSDYATVTAAVEGQSPGNLDQVIEINKGRNDNIEVGMAVISSAGLIGKITAPVLPDRAYVMLLTDPQYVVQVKIVAPPPPPEPPTTPAPAPPPPTTLPPARIRPPRRLPPEDPTATTPPPTTTVPAPTTTIDPPARHRPPHGPGRRRPATGRLPAGHARVRSDRRGRHRADGRREHRAGTAPTSLSASCRT